MHFYVLLNIEKKGTKVSLHEPSFQESNALNYLSECINSGWVSTAGEFVNKFENP